MWVKLEERSDKMMLKGLQLTSFWHKEALHPLQGKDVSFDTKIKYSKSALGFRQANSRPGYQLTLARSEESPDSRENTLLSPQGDRKNVTQVPDPGEC